MGFTKRSFFVAAVGLCALIGFVPQASAFVAWSNANGSADFFDWSNGGSDNGLFGDPMVVDGNTLLFIPGGWRADSLDGVPEISSDRLQVDLKAHQGESFTQIIIHEAGDYGILGEGGVSAYGAAFAVNKTAFGIESGVLGSIPAMPFKDEGSGTWEAETIVDLDGWTDLTLVFNNNLLAITGADSISFIEKKVIGITFTPEPASMLLLASGGLLLIRRRRSR
jgi:hypothetical protein